MGIVGPMIAVACIGSFIVTRILANILVVHFGVRNDTIILMASNRCKKKALKNWGVKIGRDPKNVSEARKLFMNRVNTVPPNPNHPAYRLLTNEMNAIQPGEWDPQR